MYMRLFMIARIIKYPNSCPHILDRASAEGDLVYIRRCWGGIGGFPTRIDLQVLFEVENPIPYWPHPRATDTAEARF